MTGPTGVFAFLRDARRAGGRGVLVMLTDVVGGSSRAPGAAMAVLESGDYRGSLSGGCVEAAVVAEARRVLRSGRAELVRFGAGSPFIDIRLPCGGGIDLLFAPDPDPDVLDALVRTLAGRRAVALVMGRDGALALERHRPGAAGWRGDRFVAPYRPGLRLLIVGHGEEPSALARLSLAFGAEPMVLSPDPALVSALRGLGVAAERLLTPEPSPALVGDEDSAVVFLFHDHDWEAALVEQALGQPAFFVGAMGSRATHERRIALLRERGFPDRLLARLIGPVGLIPATRDPETLALSVLAQVAAAHREAAVR